MAMPLLRVVKCGHCSGFLCCVNYPQRSYTRPPSAVVKLLGATDLDLHLLRAQGLQHHLLHLLDFRCLFLSSFMTVVGLTCNTRAVSRMPLAFSALSTICCCTLEDGPA